jgi:hypothetical protein
MKRDIIVVENFYSNPDAIVRYAQGLEYVYPYSQTGTPDEGKPITWRASRYKPARLCPLKSSKTLIARLEELIGETIDVDTWNLEFPVDEQGYPRPDHRSVMNKSAWWNCCFHAKHDSRQVIGGGVHSHTDFDSWNPVGLDGWAGLVYLNKEPPDNQGGLRTWRNKDPRKHFDWMTHRDNWILQDTLANNYNRLILHRGCIPHSGSNGWGDSVFNGRFYQTFFFRVKERRETRSVSPDDLQISW